MGDRYREPKPLIPDREIPHSLLFGLSTGKDKNAREQ